LERKNKMVQRTANTVTNRDLYDAINGLRSEFGGAIQRLDDKFTTLEAGRLTRAEGNINDLRVEVQKMINSVDGKIDGVRQSGATLNAKAVIVGSIILVILTGLAESVFTKVVLK